MRRRHLELESFQHRASVEFANAIPRVTVDGRERFNPVTSYMTSTLRLALGSFVTARSGRAAPSPLVDCVDELVALQDQLEGREAR
jgi:hypothetical protein